MRPRKSPLITRMSSSPGGAVRRYGKRRSKSFDHPAPVLFRWGFRRGCAN
jgi:hypothetical protein